MQILYDGAVLVSTHFGIVVIVRALLLVDNVLGVVGVGFVVISGDGLSFGICQFPNSVSFSKSDSRFVLSWKAINKQTATRNAIRERNGREKIWRKVCLTILPIKQLHTYVAKVRADAAERFHL